MTVGSFSQKPWQPVLLTVTLSSRPRRRSSWRRASATASAPEAMPQLPEEQTEIERRPACWHWARICSRSDTEFSLGIVVSPPLSGLARFPLAAVTGQQPLHLGLRHVVVDVFVHAHHRSQSAAADAANRAHRKFVVDA